MSHKTLINNYKYLWCNKREKKCLEQNTDPLVTALLEIIPHTGHYTTPGRDKLEYILNLR